MLVGMVATVAAIPGTTVASSCNDPGYSPMAWGPPSGTANFTYSLGVSIRYQLTVANFTVKYSWDSTSYDLGGGGTIGGFGGSITFHSTEILAPKEGNDTISGHYDSTIVAPGGTQSSFKCRFGPLPFETLSYEPYVRPSVVATATPVSGDVPLNVSFAAVVSGGYAPYTYDWAFGDGTTGTGPTPTHTYTAPLSNSYYTASVTVTDGRSNSTTGTVDIAATAPVRVTASASPLYGDPPLAVSFSAYASYGNAPYAYTWAFGDGGTATGADVLHTYTSPGTFVARVLATDSSPTPEDANATVTIHVSGPAPVSVTASAVPPSGTAPATISFSAKATGGAAPYTFAWSFGDGGTSTLEYPTHTFESAGTYHVAVVAKDANGASATTGLTVTVAAPVAPISAAAATSVSSGTAPLTVTFTVDASGGVPPYTYAWDFGDGEASTAQNPTHLYTTPGTFSVTVLVTDANGGSATRVLTVTVRATVGAAAGPLLPAWMAVEIGAAVAAVGAAGTVLAWRRLRSSRLRQEERDYHRQDPPQKR